MAKPPDNEVFFVTCNACHVEGPSRATALMAVESASKMGWHVSADVRHCPACAHRIGRLEKAFALRSEPGRER